MRLSDTFLMCGVAVSLALAVTRVVTRVSTREPVQRLEQQPVSAADGAPRQAVAEAQDSSVALTRAAAVFDEGDDAPLDAQRRREGRRREAEFLAEFLALRTEQGSEVFERTVREVLASRSESQGRKVAGLRALHAAGVPGTDAVLAAAVEGQADVSDGSSLSVPRCALKLLFERAPAGEDARRALARLAFVADVRISADLRRQASTALAGSIRGPRKAEVERLLSLEAKPVQLAACLEALAHDTNFGASSGR
jgi:hypothetical protein